MIYVMADIHGNMRRFKSVMNQINLQPEDTLYVLGDVVDRYPDGIKILRMIMAMPNAKMLLGNHEYMMMNAIGNGQEATERLLGDRAKRLWYRNGGQVTHEYLKRIRKSIREEVFSFLRQLPYNIDVDVNGVKYKLVHASPLENYMTSYYYSSRYRSMAEFAVWERWNETMPVPEGYVMIFGHTPTIHFTCEEPWSIWKCDEAIGIDCGSGYADGRLACLRLDDMKEFYSDEKEGENG